jgi:hypothetical protein
MGAFRVARSASDQDDQAGMVSGLTSKRQKVIAVAADEDQSLRGWPLLSALRIETGPIIAIMSPVHSTPEKQCYTVLFL